MLTKFLTAKAVTVAALTAAVAVGGVAAAATVARSDNDTGKTASALHKADAAEDAGKPDTAGQPGGPDATGAAKKGLCTAWAAGKGAENGAKEDAVAFQALAKAAGGAGNVASFCAEASAASKGKAADVELADAAKSGLCRAFAAGEASENGGRESVAAFELLAKAAGGTDSIATFCADTAGTPAPSDPPDQTTPTPSSRAGEGDHPAPPTSITPRGSAPDDPGKPSA